MIAVKEAYNISIKSSFLQVDREELVVEREKELGNIKYYDTGIVLSELPCMNNMGKVYSRISDGSLSDASQLIRVQEAVGCYIKLQSVADNFLNYLASCVEKYNGLERAQCVMRRLIWFGNDNEVGRFEVERPVL